MYIKIKHIKQFLLIAACIFFAGFNYMTYVNADNTANVIVLDSDKDGLTDAEEKLYGTDSKKSDSDGDGYSDGVEVKSGYDPTKPAPGDKLASLKVGNSEEEIGSTESLTEKFSNDFQSFLATKSDTSVSTTDVSSFVDSQLATNMGEPMTFETLPEMDRSQIKVLSQDYGNLTENERKQKRKDETIRYLEQMIYLLISNAPRQIETEEDFLGIVQEFEENLRGLSNPDFDTKYFDDLGNRLKIVVNQMMDIEVPENAVETHVTFLRLAKGLLSMQDAPSTNGDPMRRMVYVIKAGEFIQLYAAFFKNDFQEYIKSTI